MLDHVLNLGIGHLKPVCTVFALNFFCLVSWSPLLIGHLLLFRILKRLKVKAPREIELEKLEQGFSIYLNGANAEVRRKQPKFSNYKPVTSPPIWKPARTAGKSPLG